MAGGDGSNRIGISVDPGRCLHARSKWANCSLCVDSCPGSAIHMADNDKMPTIDSLKCLHCGQCLSACPLDAFSSPEFTERQLLSRVLSEKPVFLRCFLPYGELESNNDGYTFYQLGTCLAALTSGALFELALRRRCFLVTYKCQECPLYRSVSQTLRCNVTGALGMLSDWGSAGNLGEISSPEALSDISRLCENEPIDLEDVECKGVGIRKTRDARTSVRSLFHGRRKNTVAAKSVLLFKAKKKHVPAWRERLKTVWNEKDLSRGQGEYLWPFLHIDENQCKACGICMQLCPTGSISHSFEVGIFEHSFVPGMCADCGLCIASCANQVLVRDYRLADRPFTASTLFAHPAKPCIRCGMPALQNPDSQKCFLCLSEPDTKTLIDKIRIQMNRAIEERSRKHEQR